MTDESMQMIIAKQVASGKLTLAEATIMSGAKNDKELATIVGQVNERDLLAIVREYDSGKPTAIADVLTPAQVADLLELELGYGEGPNGHRLNSVMHSLVLAEHGDAAERVEAVFNQSGPDIFATFFLSEAQATVEVLYEHLSKVRAEGAQGMESLRQSEYEMNDHSWQRLLWLILSMEDDILPVIIARMKGMERAQEEAERRAVEADEEGDKDDDSGPTDSDSAL